MMVNIPLNLSYILLILHNAFMLLNYLYIVYIYIPPLFNTSNIL